MRGLPCSIRVDVGPSEVDHQEAAEGRVGPDVHVWGLRVEVQPLVSVRSGPEDAHIGRVSRDLVRRDVDVPLGRRHDARGDPAIQDVIEREDRRVLSAHGLDRRGSLALRAARHPEAELAKTFVTPAAAFRAARHVYLNGERLDMQRLAAELGISRATLYRWTGQRDQLLADVLWSLSDAIFEQAKRDHPRHTGSKRLLAISRQHVGALVEARPLQILLKQETHAALRILTSRDGGVQSRTVQKLAELYREEQEAGAFQPRADVTALAYAVVRVTEGFIYNDAILAVEPQLNAAEAIVALLLE